VPFVLEGRAARAHRLVRLAGLAVLIVFLMWAATIVLLSDLTLPLTIATDPWLWTLRVLSAIVFIGGTLVAGWHAAVVCGGQRRWYSKLWSTVLVVACLTVLWTALACHLISFSSGY
jgi:hypothetical protein